MKLAPLRRPGSTLPGVSGVARLDRRVARLVGRLNPGDIAIIDQTDLDRVVAESLVAAKVAAVINAQPSISGRYPNLGPELLLDHNIVLIDNVGSEIFAAVKEGTKVRIDLDTVYLGEDEIAHGTPQSRTTIADQMTEAKAGLTAQLEAFAANTSEFMVRERRLLLEGDGLPELRTRFAGRHALVVVRGFDHVADLKRLKHYIREYKPVLIGVDGGADALLEAGHKPHLIVGDMDAVSERALRAAKEIVVRTDADGRAPGLARTQDQGIETVGFATTASSEDAAMLIADHGGASMIVAVGTHATLNEFLDKGRAGMASAFLTRLRVGAKLVDAKGVAQLYRNRISAAALLLLVIAAVIAIVAAAAVSETGRTFLQDHYGHDWDQFVHWVKGLFNS